jgi:hypothetical protein
MSKGTARGLDGTSGVDYQMRLGNLSASDDGRPGRRGKVGEAAQLGARLAEGGWSRSEPLASQNVLIMSMIHEKALPNS